jgi:hypothetical protein
MKKFILILIVAFTSLIMRAADPVATLDLTQGYVYYAGAAKDTCGSGDTTVTFTVYPNKLDKMLYDANVKITEVSGTTGRARLVLKGRNLPTDAFTVISNSFYWGAGSDTTINVTQTSTAQFYREYLYQLSMTNTGNRKFKIGYVDLLFKK